MPTTTAATLKARCPRRCRESFVYIAALYLKSMRQMLRRTAETSENTVVTEYEPVKKRSDSYQSEAELEQEFIRMLCEQGYEYLSIHTENDLILNLRNKLCLLYTSPSPRD